MQVNNFYQIHHGELSQVSSLPTSNVRISVFERCQLESNEIPSRWLELLELMPKGLKAYCNFRLTHSLLVLDLYLDKLALAGVLDNVIRPSGFDYQIWPNSQHKPELLVFDMDSTFIQIEVIDELARQHGVGESVSQVTEAAMRGELDFSESLISRVACLEGLSESVIHSISENLPLSEGVASLVDCCHQAGIKIAIVSGGFTPFVSHLKESMGLFKVKANNLEIENGKLTGKVSGGIVDAQAKAHFVTSLASELGLPESKVMAIGDGANDLQMMKVSGYSLAYRAKPAVQAQAGGIMNKTSLNHLAEIFEWPV